MIRKLWMTACVASALPSACLAANATHPYANVDPRNDAGNDTGDARVDQLNAAQLDGAQAQQRYADPPPAYRGGYAPYGYAPPPGYGQPPAYAPQPGYPPAPGYAPPPGYPPPG